MSQQVPMTPNGLVTLKDELEYLSKTAMPDVVKEIEEAREKGDLKENAEYHAAKDRQGQIHGKMRYLKDRIARAQVIDPAKLGGDRVVFGAIVTLFEIETEQEIIYQIVGEHEADPNEGRISITSPLARGILGKEEGEEAKVKTPKGIRVFEVAEVAFPDA